MTRPYTLSVGGHETKELYEEREVKSMRIRGRHATLQKKLKAELEAVLGAGLDGPVVAKSSPSPKRRA